MKFPKSVMIWGDVMSAVGGPLCFIESKVNAAVRAGKVTFKMYFTTDYKVLALKSNQ